jgi:hypothetical protein
MRAAERTSSGTVRQRALARKQKESTLNRSPRGAIMPLFVVGDDREITNVPHETEFSVWKNRLTPGDREAISDEFDRLIDEKLQNGTDILTSSWLPDELSPNGGQDWDGTPFQAIWDRACRQDWTATGWCFGLLLWEHMMNRPETWYCMKCELDGNPIGGTTYFQPK